VRKQELDLEGGERVSKRDYERLERQLHTRDREASLLREQIEDLQSLQRQNESMQITIDLMKAQFEREKRMVEDKIRELTAASAREVELKK
jgi:polyhydroxyalkanoate synthesis regulator protein